MLYLCIEQDSVYRLNSKKEIKLTIEREAIE